MFSSLRLARSRSQSAVGSGSSGGGGSGGGTGCAFGGDRESSYLNGDASERLSDDSSRDVERHVYQVTPQGLPQGLSSCPTSPLLSGKPARPAATAGKPPKTPRSLARRGSSKWGLDKALCPSIGSLRERGGAGPRWDDELGLTASSLTSSPSSDVCTCSKVTRVAVTRQDGCLGITVRGGAPQPLVITSVHPGGPADREGSIRPGDRLLAVDGTNLQLADLSAAHSALRGHHKAHHQHNHHNHDSAVAVLTIEYSVCVVGAVVGAQGPLLVELARPPAHHLGLSLRTDRGGGLGGLGSRPRAATAVLVDDIKPASVADRSGALHRGDQILAVDDVRVDGTDLTASDVMALLAGGLGGHGGHAVLRLEILPAHCLPAGSPQQFGNHQRSPCPSESGLSAYNALRSLRGYDNGSLASSAAGSGSAVVSHTETLTVLLRPEPLSGYGLAVRASAASRIPVVGALHPDGPAERSGCLQVGDRIVAVDDREVDAEQLALLLDNPGPPLALRVSFPVAESVVPGSGVFTVKLAKCRPGLGITITGNKTGEYLHISDIKRGSVAHRSGTLAVGDRLLEIDGLSLGLGGLGGAGPGLGPGGRDGRDLGRALDHAARILHNSGDVVTLKVLKDEAPSELGSSWGGWSGGGGWGSNWGRCIEYPLDEPAGPASPDYSVEYTVELVRRGGTLGLTIAGSEDPADCVTISGLTPGGLAEQTGALHIGDRLLAINGESLRGRRLSEAIALFQNSADVVTLRIARTPAASAHPGQRPADRKGVAGIPSVDSAVESWASAASASSPSQRNASLVLNGSPAGSKEQSPCRGPIGGPIGGPQRPSGSGQAGSRAGRVKLTPLPLPPPALGQPLSRRAGSCPSLDCLLQTEAAGGNLEWDESLEDLESAAATAASLSMRKEEPDTPTSPTSPSISPPADFRGFEGAWQRPPPSQSELASPSAMTGSQAALQGTLPGAGHAGVHGPQGALWPRPPPFPAPTGRLTAAKALNNDWRQRQQQQQQRANDSVDSLATSPKLSSFQWANGGSGTVGGAPAPPAPCRPRPDRDDSVQGSLRNLHEFPELNNLERRGARFVFEEPADTDAGPASLRASSLLLEEAAADALHLHDLGLQQPMQLYQVTIYKDSVYEDFGFSVSDGLYERGVFINRIRKGGPADATGVLRPYDRILQVNETRTHDFDCCLTVPLIAAAGDRIQLIVARHPDTTYQLPLDDSYLGSNTVTQTI